MNPRGRPIEKWKPGVSKAGLLLMAGIMWMGIGVMLDVLSYGWLRGERPDHAVLVAVIGLLCALVIHHFGFLRVVDKNLARILPMEGRRCIFSFMPLKSYILIIVMMLMGFLLRHSAIPKLYLSILYIGIGTALILSSVRYLRYLLVGWRKSGGASLRGPC
jgi:hypothetical protein